MLKLEVTFKNGEHKELTITKFKPDRAPSILKGYMDKHFGYESIRDVSKVRVLDVNDLGYGGGYNVDMLNLSVFNRLDQIDFKKGVKGFNRLYLPRRSKYKIYNIPKCVDVIRCSSWATIIDMKKLMDRNVNIVMKTI